MPNWSCSRSSSAADQRPAVQQRAVAAAEVLDVELAVDQEDAGVLAADGGRVQDDVAVRVAAQGDGIALQGEDLSGFGPLQGLQYRHEVARRCSGGFSPRCLRVRP